LTTLPVNIKKILIPAFCLLHIAAIFWWTLPHSFGGMLLANSEQNNFEIKALKVLMFEDKPWASSLLHSYIDFTGNQQYWDFFAPQSPKFHQYLSVCHGLIIDADMEKISCQGKALFSNFADDFARFKLFGSDRSRLYRLTENLSHLDDPLLLAAFTTYYQNQQNLSLDRNTAAQLVMHQFELHPKLHDLPKPGYRGDKILWVSD
jgi:hypothetical protein